MRVEVDHADDRVGPLALGVGDDRVVGGVEEADVVQALERGVLAADVVQALDHRQQRAVERALLELVLLGVEVLLAARALDVLVVLVARVDAVARAQRGAQDEADREGRRAALGEVVGEDVRRGEEEVGPEVLALRAVGELVDVLGELPAVVLPGEVRVALREADLGQLAHDRAAGERLGQEDHVGVGRADLRDQPLPEGEGLGVRVVDAEDLHAAVDPVAHDVQQRVPQAAPVLGAEVDVVDVLVLLGRVLGVLERAVGAAEEPLRVLLEPRVVGRAVDREVQARRRCRARARSRRARGSPRRCRARGGSRRGRRSRRRSRTGCRGRPGSAVERVVAALAVGVADRVDRRHVEDVEAELGDARAPAPATPLKPPHERGKSSYQEPKRASVRSTSTSRWLGQLGGLGALLHRLDELEQRRVQRRVRDRWRSPRRRPSGARASSPLARSAAARSSTAPSLSSPLRSGWPNSTLRASSSRQPAKRSTHAWMSTACAPASRR